MVAVCDISLTALVALAPGELSRASGSYKPSMDTAVRSTSMGSDLGTLARKSVTGLAIARLALKSAFRASSSARFGSRPFHKGK